MGRMTKLFSDFVDAERLLAELDDAGVCDQHIEQVREGWLVVWYV
jgi:hypothetical protein